AIKFLSRGQQAGAAETADIAEAELPGAVVQDQDQVSVSLHDLVCRHDGQLPGHAEMQEQDSAALQVDHDPFAAALDFFDAQAAKLLAPLGPPWRTQPLAAGADGSKSVARQAGAQLANNSLDFRQ